MYVTPEATAQARTPITKQLRGIDRDLIIIFASALEEMLPINVSIEIDAAPFMTIPAFSAFRPDSIAASNSSFFKSFLTSFIVHFD